MTGYRILQLATKFAPGGIQRHILDVSHWLRDRDWSIAFAGTPGDWMNEGIDPTFYAIDLKNVAHEGGAIPQRFLAAHSGAQSLRRILKRERFDLIHAHESAPALVARLATYGMKIPIALTFHGAEPERVRQFGMIAKRCAHHVLTPSRMSADELAMASGIDRASIRVIGLGVHQPPSVNTAEVQALRDRLLGDGDTLVVSIARLTHQKAIDHLIAIAKRVHDQRRGARFVIVGDGPQRDLAKKWISDAGLEGAVTLAGASATAHIYLAASDVFLLPSRWESLPITIVEAFRAGLPVIATNTGGVRELVDDTVGYVAQVGDIDALAHALSLLVGDREERATRARAARARSREARFDPDAVNQMMADAYRDMINSATERHTRHG